MNSRHKNNTFLALSITILVFLLCYNVINAEEKIKIYADEIRVNEVSQKVNATGDAIAINENNIKIKSNKLSYDKSKKSLEAN